MTGQLGMLYHHLVMKSKSVLNLVKAMKQVALWSAVLTGLAVTGLGQTTPEQDQTTPISSPTEQAAEASAQTAPAQIAGYRVEETLLGPFEWMSGLGIGPSMAISADKHHIAYIIRGSDCQPAGSKECILIDGHPSPLQDKANVRDLVLSADGKHVAYMALKGKSAWPVVDGQELQECVDCAILLDFHPQFLTFSPDGKRLAYKTGNGSRKHPSLGYVLDGKSLPENDDVQNLEFSPDSAHVAYAAKNGSQWNIFVDGKRDDSYDEVTVPVFSPDSKRVTYKGRKGSNWKVIVDGQAGQEFEQIQISDAGRCHDCKGRVLSDREFLWGESPGTSPDGKHAVYLGGPSGPGGLWSLVVDGQPGPQKKAIGNWALSIDGRHVAYIALLGGMNGTLPGKVASPYGGGRWSVILDGHEGGDYSLVLPGTLCFDTDGTLEYLAVHKENHSLGEQRGSLYRVKYIPMQ